MLTVLLFHTDAHGDSDSPQHVFFLKRSLGLVAALSLFLLCCIYCIWVGSAVFNDACNAMLISTIQCCLLLPGKKDGQPGIISCIAVPKSGARTYACGSYSHTVGKLTP